MGQRDEYELVFVHPGSATPVAEDVVVVHRTERKGPGGHPVYTDDTGIVQAEISDRDEVRMIASGGHQAPSPVVQVRRLV
ncbi:DUF6296 family protein [Streptomyces sp. NPDC001922]|uniref:DUF6296 family protein n=1 Tax=Streptomyces sp. NPDC001922 TaxID=3364624 RepID=UPI0036AB957E